MSDKIKLKYNKHINIFEDEFLKKLKPETKYEGYLINLEDYKKLKEKTDYDKLKKQVKLNPGNINNLKEEEKIFPINGIKLKTQSYLINMLCNDNEYIIINKALWECVCEKGKEKEESISYKIDKNKKIIITLEKNKKLNFKQNDKINLIINKKNVDFNINEKSKINEIDDIFESINIYYNFEKQFINKLSLSNKKQEFGCLISKKWFDKWLNYSYYEEIKKIIINKDIEKPEIKHKIKDELIYYQEKNNISNSELYNLNNICPTSVNEIENNIIENDSLVIVGNKFCLTFIKKNIDNFIRYKLYNNKVEIIFNSSSFIVDSSNNIISKNLNANNNINNNPVISSDDNNNLNHLKNFIKYIYFRGKIDDEIKSNHKVSKNVMNDKAIYLTK